MTVQRPDPERLYQLLPAVDRSSDVPYGEPLHALLRIVSGQSDLLRTNIQNLWDNFFIETADRWVVPYIGDLVANRTLHDIDLAAADATARSLFTDLNGPNLRPVSYIRTRADVAKTIYYRRRKGTVAMLEELAGDVTGWAAHVVEFFSTLTWTQNLNHLRLSSTGCAALGSVDACARISGPFDAASHTLDVRPIDTDEGWYGVPNIGFFLWRLRSLVCNQVVPRSMPAASYRKTFSPLGQSAPLFMEWDTTPGTPVAEDNAPGPIPVPLFHDAPDRFYGAGASIVVTNSGVPLPLAQIECRNLRRWTTLAQPTGPEANMVWVDVARGRLMVGDGLNAANIGVTFYCGTPAELGGGSYDRTRWLIRAGGAVPVYIDVDGTALTLDGALALWAAHKDRDTVIRITTSGNHALTATIALHQVATLAIEAANSERPLVQPAGGVVLIQDTGPGSTLTLGGLLIEGGIEVDQDLKGLRLLHTTLVPGRSILEEAPPPATRTAIDVSSGTDPHHPINAGLQIEIAFSILGPIRAPRDIGGLSLLDSIVDGVGGAAVSDSAGTRGPSASIERSTLFGRTFFKQLTLASESIFTDLVTVEMHVVGCARFSFIPHGSTAPRQFRCQPSLEIAEREDAARKWAANHGATLPYGWQQLITDAVVAFLVPSFESSRYGDPTYAMLRLNAPAQIRTGAEDGSEMGVYCHLKEALRAVNLRLRLDEYLPFGLTAGLLYVGFQLPDRS